MLSFFNGKNMELHEYVKSLNEYIYPSVTDCHKCLKPDELVLYKNDCSVYSLMLYFDTKKYNVRCIEICSDKIHFAFTSYHNIKFDLRISHISTEEEYFQASLVHDLSNFNLQFFIEAKSLFDNACKNITCIPENPKYETDN